MIVSQRMAEEAAGVLGLKLDFVRFEGEVTAAFRYWSKVYHPDKAGGNVEKFIAIDRAKCILLGWLEHRAKDEPANASISSATCPMCHGTGRRTLRRGFRSMTMICGTCRGHGELVPPEKVEE